MLLAFWFRNTNNTCHRNRSPRRAIEIVVGPVGGDISPRNQSHEIFAVHKNILRGIVHIHMCMALDVQVALRFLQPRRPRRVDETNIAVTRAWTGKV